MARTTEEIIATMNVEQASQPSLSGLNSPSQTSIYKLWKYIVAQCANLLEQLVDKKKIEIENALLYGVPPSLAWLRSKAFEFQYDATTPQEMTLIDFVPTYDPVDVTKRIITRCTIKQASGAVVYVYVAKNTPPEKLTTTELAAIQGYYINSGNGTNRAVGIGYGGQVIALVSLDPDLLFLEATITYNGKFASTIQAGCITAIQNYISELGQAPLFQFTEMINRLKDVPGFFDIFINNLSCRSAAIPFGSGTSLILANEVLYSGYNVESGYMIGETTTGETLTNKITFTAI
jgi:hypothetical protein